MNKDVLPPNFAGLSEAEQAVIAAYRAKDLIALAKLAQAGGVIPEGLEEVYPQDFTPEQTARAYVRDSLDMTQVMAGAIIGRLIEQRHFTRTQLFQDSGQGLYLLHKDIAAAIREVLPTIDLKELEEIRDGKND